MPISIPNFTITSNDAIIILLFPWPHKFLWSPFFETCLKEVNYRVKTDILIGQNGKSVFNSGSVHGI